jgi:hypothetical protein
MHILHNIGALGVISLLSFNLNAESSHLDHSHDHSHDEAQQKTNQEAHLHGYAELTLALEGSTLEISFKSPAANIVGFEHKRISNQQLQMIDRAKQILESPAELFIFSAGNCSLTQMNADFSELLNSETLNENEHHSSGRHESAHKESHSEITASYNYHCPQGEKLDTIRANLINRFPKIDTIKAMWLTDHKQDAVELTPKSNLIKIK